MKAKKYSLAPKNPMELFDTLLSDLNSSQSSRDYKA